MKNIFTEHPQQVGETYFQHMKWATLFGSKMIMGGCFCIIHAIFPFIFQKTGSNILINIIQNLVERTPVLENRFLGLSEAIDKKKETSEKELLPSR